MAIFKALVIDPDLECEFIDGSVVKAHQYSTGAISNDEQAIGKSVARNTAKIHMALESNRMPTEFEITGGQVQDYKVAPELLDRSRHSDYKIADKGYNSEALRQQTREQGSIPIIPRKSNSTMGNSNMDWDLYKCRHLIENIFILLKHLKLLPLDTIS